MKNKFLSIFVILGAFLGIKSQGSFGFALGYVLCLIGGFCFVAGAVLFTSVYGGTVWGVKIPKSSAGKKATLLSVPALIVGGFGLGCTILCLLTFSSAALIGLALFVIGLVIASLTMKSISEKATARGNNALCLGEIDLFKEIDSEIHNAAYFVVAFEGVALFSGTNYCYQVYRYEDYRLGELSTPQEVALVGMYFVQKYHDEFTFKVDMEVIPGEPGQTVVAVGTGGIGIARTSGTRDQRIFRSYIFTKK